MSTIADIAMLVGIIYLLTGLAGWVILVTRGDVSQHSAWDHVVMFLELVFGWLPMLLLAGGLKC